MIEKALIINTHSSNLECLQIFFFCMEKYIGQEYFSNVYLFIDECEYEPPAYVTVVNYDSGQNYRDQMVHCLSKVKEEFALYSNEDYLFYDKAKLELAEELLGKLLTTDLSFVKFCHLYRDSFPLYEPKLFLIDKRCRQSFSQTLSFWKVKDFYKIHVNCPPSEIGAKGVVHGHLEEYACDVTKMLDIKGVSYYNGEKPRGKYHADTEVFPHIASAVERGGVWTTIYPEELARIKKEYNESNSNQQR